MPAAKTPAKKRAAPKPERAMLRRTMFDHVTPETKMRGSTRQRLAFSEIENAYANDPLVYRGVNKKSRDMVKKWHGFAPAKPTAIEPDAAVVETLLAWARKVNLPATVVFAIADCLSYGDAYIEKVYAGDTAPTEAPVTVKGAPATLAIVNPATIRPVRDTDPESPTLGELLGYEQFVAGMPAPPKGGGWTPGGVRYHPSRIVHLRFYDLGDDPRGLGAIEVAYRNTLSKIKADVSLGDIISWHAKGFYVLNIEEGSDEEVREGFEMLRSARKKGVNEFAGTERHKFDIKTPAQIDPTGILTSFFVNLAGALDMPKDMLIGASAGAVSGSQTNLRDYYEDTQAMVELHLTPFLETLYAAALGVERADLPVLVKWNPLYVDEKTEADTRFQNAQAASVAYRDGVMTVNEYRSRIGLPSIAGGDSFYEPPTPPSDTGSGAQPGDQGAAPADDAKLAKLSLANTDWRAYYGLKG